MSSGSSYSVILSWTPLLPFFKAVNYVTLFLVVQTSTDEFNSANRCQFGSANPLNLGYDMVVSHVHSFPVISLSPH